MNEQYDVDEEDEVDKVVEQCEARVRVAFERHVEGHHHGSVDCEQQDEPVPHVLELPIDIPYNQILYTCT